jgi:hypothetical protein
MEKLYTENALIRYIYKESDLFERLEVEHAIEFEKDINRLYLELCELFNILPKFQFGPSQNSIEKILSFSKMPD